MEGKTSSSLSSVYENLNSSEEKHTASIVELSESLVVRRSRLSVWLVDFFIFLRVWRTKWRPGWMRRFTYFSPRKLNIL